MDQSAMLRAMRDEGATRWNQSTRYPTFWRPRPGTEGFQVCAWNVVLQKGEGWKNSSLTRAELDWFIEVASLVQPNIDTWLDSLAPFGAWWGTVARDEFRTVALELLDAGLAEEQVKGWLKRVYDAIATEYGD